MFEKKNVPLPVMIGYNGSESSDTYSVAHQMDFLTEDVFHSVEKTHTHSMTIPRANQFMNSNRRDVIHLTFHYAGVQLER